MDPTCKCCEVSTMCGYNLRQGVIFIGTVTIFISLLILAHAVVCFAASSPGQKGFNGQPVLAMNFIFCLYSMSVSFYQILISLLLIWQATRAKDDIFICTLWHVSHIAIVTLYCFFFTAKTAVCFVAKKYFQAVATAVMGIFYEALFIYFVVVVNSFSYGIEEIIYY